MRPARDVRAGRHLRAGACSRLPCGSPIGYTPRDRPRRAPLELGDETLRPQASPAQRRLVLASRPDRRRRGGQWLGEVHPAGHLRGSHPAYDGLGRARGAHRVRTSAARRCSAVDARRALHAVRRHPRHVPPQRDRLRHASGRALGVASEARTHRCAALRRHAAEAERGARRTRRTRAAAPGRAVPGFRQGIDIDFWEQVFSWRDSGCGVLVVTHMQHDLDRVDHVVELHVAEES